MLRVSFSSTRKVWLSSRFSEWIVILFKTQESCVINGGKTTYYFPLEKDTRQEDPVSTYLLYTFDIPFIKKAKVLRG